MQNSFLSLTHFWPQPFVLAKMLKHLPLHDHLQLLTPARSARDKCRQFGAVRMPVVAGTRAGALDGELLDKK